MPRQSSCPRDNRRYPSGHHVRARTTGLRIVNRAAFLVLLLTACVAMVVLSVPQLRKLRTLEGELSRASAKENHVRAYKSQKTRELSALRDDPAYLELVARDRLDLYRRGERIYRIAR